jgi:protein-disulfide isomerase
MAKPDHSAATKLNTIANVVLLVVAAAWLFMPGGIVQRYRGARAQESEARSAIESWPEIASTLDSYNEGRRVVVAFVDYACSVCRASDVIASNIANDLGVEIVTRFVPSSRQAALAAAVALCAAEQDEPASVNRALYDRSGEWNRAGFDWYAFLPKIGVLDTSTMRACLEGEDVWKRLEQHHDLATKVNVTMTPTYFGARGRHIGPLNLRALQDII